MNAGRRGRRDRLRHSRVLTLVALVATVVLLAIGPWTWRGVDAQVANPALVLVHQTAFVGPDGTFRVELSTRDLPAGTRLTLTVYGPVTDRARLARTMSGEQLGTAITSTPTVTTTGTTTVALSLPVSSTWPAPAAGVVLPDAGVYPVTVDATTADGTRLDRMITHLLRLPAENAATDPLEVGTVVAVDAAPTADADGTPTLSTADADRVRRQLAIVDEATAPTRPLSLTLDVSPFVLSTLRETGTTIGPTTVDRPVLAGPWVSIDAVSLLAGGQESTVVDEFRVGDTALAALLGSAPDHRTAIIDGTTSARALDLAASRGTRSIVLHSSQLRPRSTSTDSSTLTRQFVIASENGATFAAMAADDAAVVPLVYGNDPVLAADHVLAELAVLHLEQPGTGRGVALVLPATLAPEGLRELLSGLSQRNGAASGSTGAPVVAPVTLDGLFSSTTVATDRGAPVTRDWGSDDPVEPVGWATTYDQARWDLRGLRTLLPDAVDATDRIDRSILAAAARSLSTVDRLAILTGAERSIRDLTSAITLPTTQRVTLTSRSGDVPLTIENALTTEAHVRITARSPKLDFPDGPTIELVVPPGTTRTVVRVTTRASGAFPMEVTVVSADGVLPVTTSRIDVRSTAISGWGLVLSIGAGLFLAVWWIRHFRHTRRARSLVDVGDVGAGETGATTPR